MELHFLDFQIKCLSGAWDVKVLKVSSFVKMGSFGATLCLVDIIKLI